MWVKRHHGMDLYPADVQILNDPQGSSRSNRRDNTRRTFPSTAGTTSPYATHDGYELEQGYVREFLDYLLALLQVERAEIETEREKTLVLMAEQLEKARAEIPTPHNRH